MPERGVSVRVRVWLWIDIDAGADEERDPVGPVRGDVAVGAGDVAGRVVADHVDSSEGGQVDTFFLFFSFFSFFCSCFFFFCFCFLGWVDLLMLLLLAVVVVVVTADEVATVSDQFLLGKGVGGR
jgi:hypothetical protein